MSLKDNLAALGSQQEDEEMEEMGKAEDSEESEDSDSFRNQDFFDFVEEPPAPESTSNSESSQRRLFPKKVVEDTKEFNRTQSDQSQSSFLDLFVPIAQYLQNSGLSNIQNETDEHIRGLSEAIRDQLLLEDVELMVEDLEKDGSLDDDQDVDGPNEPETTPSMPTGSRTTRSKSSSIRAKHLNKMPNEPENHEILKIADQDVYQEGQQDYNLEEGQAFHERWYDDIQERKLQPPIPGPATPSLVTEDVKRKAEKVKEKLMNEYDFLQPVEHSGVCHLVEPSSQSPQQIRNEKITKVLHYVVRDGWMLEPGGLTFLFNYSRDSKKMLLLPDGSPCLTTNLQLPQMETVRGSHWHDMSIFAVLKIPDWNEFVNSASTKDLLDLFRERLLEMADQKPGIVVVVGELARVFFFLLVSTETKDGFSKYKWYRKDGVVFINTPSLMDNNTLTYIFFRFHNSWWRFNDSLEASAKKHLLCEVICSRSNFLYSNRDIMKAKSPPLVIPDSPLSKSRAIPTSGARVTRIWNRNASSWSNWAWASRDARDSEPLGINAYDGIFRLNYHDIIGIKMEDEPESTDFASKVLKALRRRREMNMTSEQKRLRSERMEKRNKEMWREMTPQEQARRSELMKARWAKLSPEERNRILEKVSNTRKMNSQNKDCTPNDPEAVENSESEEMENSEGEEMVETRKSSRKGKEREVDQITSRDRQVRAASTSNQEIGGSSRSVSKDRQVRAASTSNQEIGGSSRSVSKDRQVRAASTSNQEIGGSSRSVSKDRQVRAASTSNQEIGGSSRSVSKDRQVRAASTSNQEIGGSSRSVSKDRQVRAASTSNQEIGGSSRSVSKDRQVRAASTSNQEIGGSSRSVSKDRQVRAASTSNQEIGGSSRSVSKDRQVRAASTSNQEIGGSSRSVSKDRQVRATSTSNQEIGGSSRSVSKDRESSRGAAETEGCEESESEEDGSRNSGTSWGWCPECQQWKSGIRLHMRRHTGETRFECSSCTRRFVSWWQHSEHEKRCLNLPLECDYCWQRFRYNMAINDHESQEHLGANSSTERYCYCNKIDIEGKDMVECSNLDCSRKWFHVRCIGVSEEELVELEGEEYEWYCQFCAPARNWTGVGTSIPPNAPFQPHSF